MIISAVTTTSLVRRYDIDCESGFPIRGGGWMKWYVCWVVAVKLIRRSVGLRGLTTTKAGDRFRGSHLCKKTPLVLHMILLHPTQRQAAKTTICASLQGDQRITLRCYCHTWNEISRNQWVGVDNGWEANQGIPNNSDWNTNTIQIQIPAGEHIMEIGPIDVGCER